MRITRPVLYASRIIITAIALSVGALGNGALAQSAKEQLDRIEAMIAEGAAREAMQEARALFLDLSDRAGFAITRVVLTTGAAPGFGNYDPSPDGIVPSGRPIHAYVEVTGATPRTLRDDLSELVFVVDFAVLDAQGQALTDVVRMGEVRLPSRSRGIDIYLDVTYNITGAPPGDYVLWTEITDGVSGASEQFELPVTISDGG